MLCVISDAAFPARFASVGNLLNDNDFLHARRTLDSYEFICVTKGVLHMNAGGREHHIFPGEFLILFPGECHYGTKPSQGELSFYWTHFYLDSPDTQISEWDESQNLNGQYYVLPETGRLSTEYRTSVLFVQLLDISKRLGFSADKQCSYALSTLLLELTNECLKQYQFLPHHTKLPQNLADILAWLSLNYDTRLSVGQIAERFGYHPSYLTALFRQYTGQTIIEYINRQRITASLNLLTITPTLSLEDISEQVGFSDAKYFMRLFKRYEGMTPSTYRKSFSEKRTNRI